MEKWLDVYGYEGLYMISNYGKVRSLEKIVDYGKKKAVRPEKILKTRISKDGYEYCILSDNKNKKTLKIHRLVAIAFIENPDSKKTVNHIDGNKLNNNSSNLEWNTHRENTMHAIMNKLRSGVKGEKSHLSKLSKKQVDEIRLLSKNYSKTRTEISKIYNISGSQVYRIVNNLNWTV
jgi:hypothetical protein